MKLQCAQILLGSNLGDREAALHAAVTYIEKLGLIITAQSPTLETDAVGFEAPPFLNKVIEITTHLSPIELLDALQNIEKRIGRTHKTKIIEGIPQYQSRIIDLDILTYGNLIIQTDRLTLPHPQIKTRPFVTTLQTSLRNNTNLRNQS